MAPVVVSAQSRTTLSPAAAMAVVAPIDLPTILKKSGPLPGVAEVREQSGTWDTAGRTRLIALTDNTSMRETLVDYDAGHSFSYRLADLTGPLGKLVAGVRGEWAFTVDGTGAIIRWTWEIEPRRGAAPLVRFVLAPLMRANMTKTCVRAAGVCDRSA